MVDRVTDGQTYLQRSKCAKRPDTNSIQTDTETGRQPDRQILKIVDTAR